MRVEGDVVRNVGQCREQLGQRQVAYESGGESRLRYHLKSAVASGYDSCLKNLFAVELGL
jgi:hypothetical protein